MEFIPLEKHSKKKKETKSVEKLKAEKKGKQKESDVIEETVAKKTKLKPRPKVIEKKNVKNKYRETLSLKQKQRVPKKKVQKKKKQEDDDDDDDEEEEKMEEEQMDVEKESEEEEEDEESENEDKEEENEDEEAYKRKCKEIDEEKKNRLFIKLKKKILNEAQIKELHPDIRSVIFPRKKNSRWCWAVFASEERADEAMKKLIKNKEVIVSKPTPYDKVSIKNKKKLKTILRKKEARKKVQNMWM